VLVECSNCAAPLDVKQGAASAKCRYCGRNNVLQQARQLAVVTPPQWQPPRVWVPPAHAVAPSDVQLKYHTRSVGCAVMLPILLTLVVPLIAAFFATGGSGWLKVKMWDGKSTLVCELNEELTIEGVKANVKSGPVIDAHTNCKLKIIDSTLKGEVGITAGVNADVELVNSTIKADTAAFESGGNAKLTVRGGKLRGKEVALRLGGNDQVSLTKTSLEGEDAAIDNARNTTLKLKHAKLKSGDVGVGAGYGLNVQMRDSSVVAAGVAFDVGSNARLSIKGKSSVTGGAGAIRAKTHAYIELDGATVASDKTAIDVGSSSELRCRQSVIRGAQSLVTHMHGKFAIGDCQLEGERKLGKYAKIE